MNISVKFGTFNVVENKGNNGISVFNGNNKVLDIANVHWWDKDAIEKALYSKEELIKENCKDVKDGEIESLKQAIEAMKKVHENEVNKLKEKYRVLSESKTNLSINDGNVVEVLETVNSKISCALIDTKARGFICSRLTQVINKLHSIEQGE